SSSRSPISTSHTECLAHSALPPSTSACHATLGVDAAVTIFPGLVTSTSTFWLLTATAAGLPSPPATPSVSPTQRCLPVPQPFTPRWVKKVCEILSKMCAEPTVQKIDTWSHLQKLGIVNYMDLLKGAATAKVADKRHRLWELICVSGDLPALHAAPDVPPPTSPHQDQDGLQLEDTKVSTTHPTASFTRGFQKSPSFLFQRRKDTRNTEAASIFCDGLQLQPAPSNCRTSLLSGPVHYLS
ncbi:hypothetical protein BaRGS_00038394, partial [Batillaria attramentaria]